MLSRRKLFKYTLIAGGLVSVGFLVKDSDKQIPQFLAQYEWQNLSQAEAFLLLLFVRVMHDYSDEVMTEQTALAQLTQIDKLLGVLTVSQRDELLMLLNILETNLGRLLLAKRWQDWDELKLSQLNSVLDEWRGSSIQLLNTTYTGLKELLQGVWYADSEHWSAIGYPGPPQIGRPDV
ncbi:MAG: hypothetical protein HKP09_00600 [Enterobacterales bacterium]|nr:hypothetical protein [Enterobacterales bacterium]